MITVSKLYEKLDRAIPTSLSCEWDNDGLMCCPDPKRPVKRVLLALDITESIVDRAIAEDFDVILSHHPLVFRPIPSLTPENPVPRKLIRLVQNGIAAMSFHTRFDTVKGGVNDALAETLGLGKVKLFGNEEGDMGRIGEVEPQTLAEFAQKVKEALGAPVVFASGDLPVKHVAVLGGSGDDFISAAKKAGADTYVSGDLAYHRMTDAREDGINLIAAGHYYTETPSLPYLARFVKEADGDIEITLTASVEIQTF